MARFPIDEVVEEVQRICSDVTGSEAEFFTPEICKRYLIKGYNRVMPMAPNDWQDGDTLINMPFDLPAETGDAPTGANFAHKPLPSVLLDLRGIAAFEPRAQIRLMHDYNDFGLAKSRMNSPTPNLLHMIFMRQGSNLHYWYRPSVMVRTSISFVRNAIDPDLNGGYFVCSERALPIVESWTAARGKWDGMKPDEARVLNQQYMEDISMAFQLERRKKIQDPYTSEATERKLGA
jgi:hypothetical protein